MAHSDHTDQGPHSHAHEADQLQNAFGRALQNHDVGRRCGRWRYYQDDFGDNPGDVRNHLWVRGGGRVYRDGELLGLHIAAGGKAAANECGGGADARAQNAVPQPEPTTVPGRRCRHLPGGPGEGRSHPWLSPNEDKPADGEELVVGNGRSRVAQGRVHSFLLCPRPRQKCC